MSIPATITASLTSLQTQVAAAGDVTAASAPTVLALQLNARQLVLDTDAAQATLAGALDTWTAPVDPQAIIEGILGLLQNSYDERDIVLTRGLVGRVASNLDQLNSGPVQRVAAASMKNPLSQLSNAQPLGMP